MLKKLVKYGNSNALVLDKALLELLNIAEGSVVKIKTDGVSLIITPQEAQTQLTVQQPVTPEGSIKDAIYKQQADYCQNPESSQEYMDELLKVFAPYAAALRKLNEPAYLQGLEEIAKKWKKDSAGYAKAVDELRKQHAPELLQLDEQVAQVSRKYAKKEYQYSGNNIVDLMMDYKKVHEKYKDVMLLSMQLTDNPGYIHESVLLAEKYQHTKNSPEYVQEHTSLISKYIPEYAQYQQELKAVSDSFFHNKNA